MIAYHISVREKIEDRQTNLDHCFTLAAINAAAGVMSNVGLIAYLLSMFVEAQYFIVLQLASVFLASTFRS